MYPHVAVGGGYFPLVFISNKSNSPWEGTATFVFDTGFSNQNRIIISPKATTVLVSPDAQKANASTGYLEITAKLGQSVSDIAASFSVFLFTPSKKLVDSIAIPKSALGRKFLLPYAILNGPLLDGSTSKAGINTGIAVRRRVQSSSPPITVTLLDEVGQQMQQKTINTGARFITEIFDTAQVLFGGCGSCTGQRAGSILVESQEPFYLVGLLVTTQEDILQLAVLAPELLSP